MRALVVLAAALLALALPAGAQAQRAWRAPELLSSQAQGMPWSAAWDTALTMTSRGEAIGTWMEQTGPDWDDRQLMIAIRSPLGASSGPAPFGTAVENGSVRLGADALGNAYISYTPATGGPARMRMRPPGGSFGDEEVVPTSAVHQLAVAPDGDVAALSWSEGIYGAFRPAGGTFGDAQQLLSGTRSAGGWSAAYSANGDLVFGGASYAPPGNPDAAPGRVYGGVRSASGELSVRELTDGSRHARDPHVGIDDAGRGVLVWAEQKDRSVGTLTAALVSQRPSGGDFGAPVALTRGGGLAPTPRVVTGRDGNFTIVHAGLRGLRVSVGRTGEPPRHLRSYFDQGNQDVTRLAGSPSGNHALLTHGLTSTMPATSLRSGDGGFASSLDLRNDCEPSEFVRLAVGDGGEGVALIQRERQILLVTDTAGTGTRDCIPDYHPESNPSPYDDDPYLPRTHGPDGGGQWFPDDDPYPGPGGGGGWGGPSAPLPVGTPTITAARAGATKRRARVIVVCLKACTVSARAKLGFDKEKALVRGSSRGSAKPGKPTLIEIPLTLSPSVARVVDQALKDRRPQRRLLLTISVSATPRGEKRKVTREVVAALGGPNSPF